MNPYRTALHIAGALVIASGITPSTLAGQGGAKRARPAAAGEATVTMLQPARSVVQRLVGRWRFAIWFAGNFDGAPDATGTRTIEAFYDDLRLKWTEQLDNAASRSEGMIGFDRRTERFYSSAVHSDGAGAEFLTGALDPAEPLITFVPAMVADPDRRLMESFTLTVIDADHFVWAPLDRGWRAVFTRVVAPESQ